MDIKTSNSRAFMLSMCVGHVALGSTKSAVLDYWDNGNKRRVIVCSISLSVTQP